METKATDRLSRPGVVAVLAGVSCLLWSSAASAIKTAYRLMNLPSSDTWSMVLFAGCRFCIAGILVILLTSLRYRRLVHPSNSGWGSALKLSLVQTSGQYLTYFVGLAYATGVNASILGGLAPLFSILMACYLFRSERMTLTKCLGCVLGLAGMIAMNLTGEGFSATFMGEGVLLVSNLCNGFSAGQSKKYSKTEDPVILTAYQFLFGGIVLCIFGGILGGRLDFSNTGAMLILLYLACVSAVAYTLWNVLIKHNEVSRVSVYGFMTPLFGVIISAVVLREFSQALRPSSLAALVLVCAGVIIVSRSDSKKSRSEVKK